MTTTTIVRSLARAVGVTLLLATPIVSARAQGAAAGSPAAASPDAAAAIAVADSALAAITRGDFVAFTDLMIPEAVLFPTNTRDGVSRYSVRTREAQRTAPVRRSVTERGWSAEARVNGAVAMVWYPYDLYVDGAWSHCGVDIFTMVRQEGRWRISAMTWSAEQPPVCQKHPKGPPPGAKP